MMVIDVHPLSLYPFILWVSITIISSFLLPLGHLLYSRFPTGVRNERSERRTEKGTEGGSWAMEMNRKEPSRRRVTRGEWHREASSVPRSLYVTYAPCERPKVVRERSEGAKRERILMLPSLVTYLSPISLSLFINIRSSSLPFLTPSTAFHSSRNGCETEWSDEGRSFPTVSFSFTFHSTEPVGGPPAAIGGEENDRGSRWDGQQCIKEWREN